MNEIRERETLNQNSELNKDDVLNVVSQLPKDSNITFTGGEIFLKHGIEEILRYTAARHKVTLASNGALLGNHAEVIVKSGVQAISISIDGPPQIHDRIRNQKGLFSKLQKSLKKLNQIKAQNGSHTPYIHFNSVILNSNYDALPETIALIKDLGGDTCTFQIFDPSYERSGLYLHDSINYDETNLDRVEKIETPALEKALQQLYSEAEKHNIKISFIPDLNIDEILLYYQGRFNLDKWHCSLPWRTMRISPYGNVFPCLNYSIGDVGSNRLANLWNNNRYIGFRRLLKSKRIFDACIGCCKMQKNDTH